MKTSVAATAALLIGAAAIICVNNGGILGSNKWRGPVQERTTSPVNTSQSGGREERAVEVRPPGATPTDLELLLIDQKHSRPVPVWRDYEIVWRARIGEERNWPTSSEWEELRAQANHAVAIPSSDYARVSWIPAKDDRQRITQGIRTRKRIAKAHFMGLNGVKALIVDHLGTPYGFAEAPHVTLPLPFEGYLLSEQFVPIPLELDARDCTVYVEWRTGAFAIGRLSSHFSAGEEIGLRRSPRQPILGRPDFPSLQSATVDANGDFSAGPLWPGEWTLSFVGQNGEFAEGSVLRALNPGTSDLGVLKVRPFYSLNLQCSPALMETEIIFGEVHIHGKKRWALRPRVLPLVSNPSGTIVLERVRPSVLDGVVWTESGRLGRFADVRIGGYESSANKAIVSMLDPGELTVVLSGEAALKRSSWRVVVQDAQYEFSPSRYNLAESSAGSRRRWKGLGSRNDRVLFQGLWPIEYKVFLMDDDGNILREDTATVNPNCGSQLIMDSMPGTSSLQLVEESKRWHRLGVLAHDGTAALTVTLPPGMVKTIENLAPGQYRIVELSPSQVTMAPSDVKLSAGNVETFVVASHDSTEGR